MTYYELGIDSFKKHDETRFYIDSTKYDCELVDLVRGDSESIQSPVFAESVVFESEPTLNVLFDERYINSIVFGGCFFDTASIDIYLQGVVKKHINFSFTKKVKKVGELEQYVFCVDFDEVKADKIIISLHGGRYELSKLWLGKSYAIRSPSRIRDSIEIESGAIKSDRGFIFGKKRHAILKYHLSWQYLDLFEKELIKKIFVLCGDSTIFYVRFYKNEVNYTAFCGVLDSLKADFDRKIDDYFFSGCELEMRGVR